MYINDKNGAKVISAKEVDVIAREILDSRPEEEKHKEYFYAIGLNAQCIIQVIDLISIGTVSSCNPPIREIAKTMLMKNCVSTIVFHNHPSGNVSPSPQDKMYTSELKNALRILGINLIDSVIIGESFYSFQEDGLLI